MAGVGAEFISARKSKMNVCRHKQKDNGAKNMNPTIHSYDIKQEAEMLEPLDFNRRSRLKDVDRSFKAEITNIIRLTDMEKLFQLRMISDDEEICRL